MEKHGEKQVKAWLNPKIMNEPENIKNEKEKTDRNKMVCKGEF